MLKNALSVKSVVIATDFSSAATAALLHAVRLTQLQDACFVLVHVIEPHGSTSAEMDIAPFRLHEALETAGRELAMISSDLTSMGVCNHWVARCGDIRGSILEVVRECRADLLVLGNRGSEGGKSTSGAIAEQIVRAAPCPVLTVPARQVPKYPKSSQRQLILVPTDLSAESQVAFSYALSLAHLVEAELLLVHALVPDRNPELQDRAMTQCRRQLKALLDDAQLKGVAARHYVRSGDPSELILSQAREQDADYIVMALREGNLVDGARLHGRARGLLCRTSCPVLTISFPGPLQPIATPQQARIAFEMMQAVLTLR